MSIPQKTMQVRIDSPGIYLSLPAHHYHADPCPKPSLSSGIAKKAALQTPRHVYHSHPRLNPECDPSSDDEIKRHTAQGSACHELFLGIGGGIEIVDFSYKKKIKGSKETETVRVADWKTDAAKEARDRAIAAKMTPRLWWEFDQDKAVVQEAKQQLEWFDMSGGREAVVITEESGFWSRSMCDILRADDLTIIDLKFTKIIADADAFGRHAYNMGYDIQAHHYARNLARMRGVSPHDVKFFFVCVECPENGPVMTAVHQLDDALRVIGRERHEAGEAAWQHALKTDRWPGYPENIQTATAPTWALSQHIRMQETANV